MGLTAPYINFIEASVGLAFGDGVRGLRMLELGDQVVFDDRLTEKTGKEYFVNRGYEHVSVDLNGEHGAVVRDLTKPAQFHDWFGSWDIVTNSGTTEHVEPFEAQYECFRILHNCMKVGGITVHLVPDIDERDQHGAWMDHCRYYYSQAFFDVMARECDYDVLFNTVIAGLRCATIRKTKNVPFMADRPKFLSLIARREFRTISKLGVAGTALRRMGLGRFLRRLQAIRAITATRPGSRPGPT